MKNEPGPMPRVPEPELMDTPEQACAYAGADFEEPHASFVDAFRRRFSGARVAGRGVDLGCGPADITLRMARAFPQLRLDGFDAGPNMLALGREAVENAGLSGRVQLFHGHLPDELPPNIPYDIVFSNSLLHHLPDPAVLWHSVRACAGAGALVFIMDLRRPASEQRTRELVAIHAADEPEVLQDDFYNSLRAAYRPGEVRAQLDSAGMDYLQVDAPGDRHLTVSGMLR